MKKNGSRIFRTSNSIGEDTIYDLNQPGWFHVEASLRILGL